MQREERWVEPRADALVVLSVDLRGVAVCTDLCSQRTEGYTSVAAFLPLLSPSLFLMSAG